MSVLLSRAPLRITLGGGGTDLPSYVEEHGGFLVAAAIDKYVYMMVKESFDGRWKLRYSETEEVEFVENIKHPIFRETLREYWDVKRPLEIACMSDVPAGTGLGSSGAFGVALQAVLRRMRNLPLVPEDLAEAASHVEMNVIGEPCGPQDTYVAAHGGLCAYAFHRYEGVIPEVGVIPISSREAWRRLEEGLLLFYMGQTRASSVFLAKQEGAVQGGDEEMLLNLAETLRLGQSAHRLLANGLVEEWAMSLERQWDLKEFRTRGPIDMRLPERRAYTVAIGDDSFVLGGKLVGAGGSGFLMVYSIDPDDTRAKMLVHGFRDMPFKLSAAGVTVQEV